MTKKTRQIDRRSLLTGAHTGAAAASMATLAGQAEAQSANGESDRQQDPHDQADEDLRDQAEVLEALQ